MSCFTCDERECFSLVAGGKEVMKMYAKMAMTTLATLAFGSSVLKAENVVKEAKEAVQQTIYDISDKDTTTVNFEKGSAVLSESAATELKTTLAAGRSDAGLKEVIIATYADKVYPRDAKDSLSKADRDLAKNRGEAIKKKLEEFGGKSVKIYNMAEKANWFERKLVTTDAQVKNEAGKSPEKQDSEDAFFQALGKRLTSIGGPGKAVVVMRYDNALAH